MWALEREFVIDGAAQGSDLIGHIEEQLKRTLTADESLLRFVITKSSNAQLTGEALILCGAEACGFGLPPSSFPLVRRPFEDTSSFNAVLIVPTGIGAEVGGHAGDAGPVAKLLAAVCDRVITHPNVINASDINELPEDSLYVEGSVLSRLLLGTIGLQPVRNNRVLVVVDEHQDECFTNAAINAVSAARAAYGLNCPQIIRLKPGIHLRAAYSNSHRAAGEVSNFEMLLDFLRRSRLEFDAVALSSVIDVPAGYHQQYFDALGGMINPWGGVEAMLTHTISSLLDVPSAHAPMFETRDIANADPGIVDPRMAAEAVSYTFLQSVLKGLQRSPRIVSRPRLGQAGLVDITNISSVIIPDGCVGLPTLAALAQGVPVIAVRENKNVMQNDLRLLPWSPGQLIIVENYWEAAGVLAAMKAGIEPLSVRRPMSFTRSSLIQTDLDVRLLAGQPFDLSEPAQSDFFRD